MEIKKRNWVRELAERAAGAERGTPAEGWGWEGEGMGKKGKGKG